MIAKECPTCKKPFIAKNNRAKFCGMNCWRLRPRKTKEEIAKKHAIYLKDKMKNDLVFRERRLKQKKDYYNKNRDHHLAKMSEARKTDKYKNRQSSYIKTDKYKKYKKEYDRKLRCKKKFGEFWESASILIDIESKISPQKYEIRKTNKTINKAQQRKRNGKIKCNNS